MNYERKKEQDRLDAEQLHINYLQGEILKIGSSDNKDLQDKKIFYQNELNKILTYGYFTDGYFGRNKSNGLF